MKKLTCRSAVIVTFALSSLLGTPTWAAEPNPCDLRVSDTASMYQMEMSELLSVGDFKKLENFMEKQYAEFRAQGNGDHLFDVGGFLNLVAQPDGALLNQWKKEMPNAFFSNYATGLDRLRQADIIRRGRPMSAVKSNEINAIDALHKKARDAMALAKLAKPDRAIVDAALIMIDAISSGSGTTAAHLKRGISVDPKNISARLTAISYLDPRWGGSFAEMDDVVTQAKSAKIPAHHVAYLLMAVENNKGSHYEIIEKNNAKAREHYKRAYDICNLSNFAKSGLARTTGR